MTEDKKNINTSINHHLMNDFLLLLKIHFLKNEGLYFRANMSRFQIVLICLLIVSTIVFSQSNSPTLSGRVLDNQGSPLIGANIIIKGTTLGGATNSSGEFIIQKMPEGEYTVTIYFIGFEQKDIPVNISEAQTYDLGDIVLSPTAMNSDPIVVTANKYEQNIQDVSVSMSSVSEKEINYRNSVTFSDALKYVPGVNLNASQVNIRGSSGFSYAVGSRILLLLDGVPLLTGDTGEIIFESVPIYLIERIEIQKVAGSALYGSNALGGVINIITRNIDYSPKFYFKVYGGLYSDPYYDEWKWSDKDRYFNGIHLNVAKKFNNVGAMFGGSFFSDDGYRENDSRDRYSASGNIQWQISPFQQLAFSGNYMYQKRRSFLWWKNLQNALRPPFDQLDDEVESKRSYLSGVYRHIVNRNQYFTVRAIWFGNRFEDTTSASGNRSTSNSFDGEVQFNNQVGSNLMTVGVAATGNFVSSNLFGKNSAGYGAIYIQDAVEWSEQFKITLGARFDYSKIKNINSDSKINPKLGLVYKISEGNAIRASFGTGFRAPSLAEVFTSTSLSGFLVIPNTDSLSAETSVSFEVGFNQNLGNWLVLDMAIFYNDFWDLIEASIVLADDNNSYIQFQNISRARVRGFEVSANSIFFNNLLNMGAGYTYVDPWDLDNNDFLKFRPRHLFYGNGRFNFLWFQIGADYRFISRYDNVDDLLTNVIQDGDKRGDAHIVDIRLAAAFPFFNQPARISFQINNLFQYNYVEGVASIAPIRNFLISFETGL
jgi:iron complex outermembrane receptor protein